MRSTLTRPTSKPLEPNGDAFPFLLDQPIFRIRIKNRLRAWKCAIREGEPIDKHRESRGFVDAFRRVEEPSKTPKPVWRRVNRAKLTAALCTQPERLHRVCIICGGGLGKTTNMLYLEHEINAWCEYRGAQLAVFLELDDLAHSWAGIQTNTIHRSFDEQILQQIFRRLKVTDSAAQSKLTNELHKKRDTGRITFLLDSLDQAGADPKGDAMKALAELSSGSWQHCPIWVSGRPAAFQGNRKFFAEDPHTRWQYFRIGQLDEAESRELVDAARQHAEARKKGQS